MKARITKYPFGLASVELKFTCNNKVLAECCFKGQTKTFGLGRGESSLD